jgi:molecular chaperone DnaK
MRKPVIALGSTGHLVLKSGSGKEEPIPASLTESSAFLLLDCSGSMAGEKLREAQRGAADFALQAVSEAYQVGIISFDSSAHLRSTLTGDASAVVKVLGALRASGSTNMAAALEMACSALQSKTGNRVIVIVTDGSPDSPPAALHAASQAKRSGIEVLAIGTGDSDQVFLDQLASRQGSAVKCSPRELARAIHSTMKALPPATQRTR